MNWKKIFTIAALTAFSASVATGQGTAPTIVQGDYISNVFGQSNFIKNPNAKLNTKDVTVSSATVSRSPTTPLVAASEFNVAVTVANGTVTWATRTFDDGMKNQNCEARFTYRGFQSTSKAHVKQGANTVATLNLSATGSDPRIASINFPCGDLSSATTFVITDTSTLGGVNEIGGIYVGLATNQANVAQAEFVGSLRNFNSAGAACIWTGNNASPIAADPDCSTYQKEGLDMQPSSLVPAITFTAPKSGNYQLSVHLYSGIAASPNPKECQIFRNGTLVQNLNKTYFSTGSNSNESRDFVSFNTQLTGGTAYTFDIRCTTVTSLLARYFEESLLWTLHRFPTSSELVVTPERQNTFGGVEWSATADWTGTQTGYTTVNNGTTWGSPILFGNATAAGTSCGLAANDIGFCIETLPPGTYKIGGNFQLGVKPASANDYCAYSANIGGGTLTDNRVVDALPRSASSSGETVPFVTLGSGLVKVTSLQKNVRVWLHYRKNPTATSCVIRSDTINYYAKPSLNITPVDQPSNSALYVQGPVLGAQTGATIAAGYVGEVLESSVGTAGTNLPTTQNNTYDINSLTLSSPGVYLVIANFSGVDTGQTTVAYINHYLFDSTNSVTLGLVNQPIGTGNPATYSTTGNYSPIASSSTVFAYVKVTSSLTIKNRIKRINANGGAGYVNGDLCKIIAVRIN